MRSTAATQQNTAARVPRGWLILGAAFAAWGLLAATYMGVQWLFALVA